MSSCVLFGTMCRSLRLGRRCRDLASQMVWSFSSVLFRWVADCSGWFLLGPDLRRNKFVQHDQKHDNCAINARTADGSAYDTMMQAVGTSLLVARWPQNHKKIEAVGTYVQGDHLIWPKYTAFSVRVYQGLLSSRVKTAVLHQYK